MTEVIRAPKRIRRNVRSRQCRNLQVGFVPTMGAFHEGHRRLIRESVTDNDVTVVSLFVNPTQFDSDQEAESYPQDRERDLAIAREESVDVLFVPESDSIYPPGDCTRVEVDLPLTDRYEGAFRQRFFEGMVRVVTKLLNLVPAQRLYMGEKDLQQLVVVRQLIQDLHFPHRLVPVPVARDRKGVAYSSRNRRFAERDWQVAGRVCELLQELREVLQQQGDTDQLSSYRAEVQHTGMELDYLDLVSYPEFEPTDARDEKAVLILAGRIGDVRLKDNLPVHHASVREIESAIV